MVRLLFLPPSLPPTGPDQKASPLSGHIILTDFGLSARLPDNAKLHSFSGTAIYLGEIDA